jgi:hypothetical protein
MKTTKNYLEQTSKHLFKFEPQISNGKPHFMKVIVNDENDTFNVLKFDEELNLISNKEYSISDWERTSPKGKSYVPTELKNWVLFYKDWGNINKISTIKHFKAIRERINEITTVTKVAA